MAIDLDKGILYSMGMDEIQAEVYLIILNKGKTGTEVLAKTIMGSLEISRDETLSVLDKLNKKKVVDVTFNENVEYFEAVNPDYFVDRQR